MHAKSAQLRPDAPLLHTHTRRSAWSDWAMAAGQELPEKNSLFFEHFYFSLQASVAGLGIAMGPWLLVRDDLESGLLTAPLGFVEDGSQYCLFSSQPLHQAGPAAILLEWLRDKASQDAMRTPSKTA